MPTRAWPNGRHERDNSLTLHDDDENPFDLILQQGISTQEKSNASGCDMRMVGKHHAIPSVLRPKRYERLGAITNPSPQRGGVVATLAAKVVPGSHTATDPEAAMPDECATPKSDNGADWTEGGRRTVQLIESKIPPESKEEGGAVSEQCPPFFLMSLAALVFIAGLTAVFFAVLEFSQSSGAPKSALFEREAGPGIEVFSPSTLPPMSPSLPPPIPSSIHAIGLPPSPHSPFPPVPLAPHPQAPSPPPPEPAPPYDDLAPQRLTLLAVQGSDVYDDVHYSFPFDRVIDGKPETTGIAGGDGNAWFSVQVGPHPSGIGHVFVYNRHDEEYQYLLGTIEVWRGNYFGDITSSRAGPCGRVNATGSGPYTVWCDDETHGSGSYITVRQVDAGYYICLGEIEVFGIAQPPSPPPLPLSPSAIPPPGPAMPPPAMAPAMPPPNQTALASRYLNAAQCEAQFADPTSRFHQLWGHVGWAVRHDWDEGCWGSSDADAFWEDALNGSTCSRNWYEGNPGALGQRDGGPTQEWVHPHFEEPFAPALLGFDENIDGWCHGNAGNTHAAACIRANRNILSLYWPVQYNVCRNFEWQLCAAQGLLPGQGDNRMRFAFAPKNLELRTGMRPLGSCTGYHPRGCHDVGYASSDIFYLETCIYATICSNGHELFELEENQDWSCILDLDGYARLKAWMVGTA